VSLVHVHAEEWAMAGGDMAFSFGYFMKSSGRYIICPLQLFFLL
jgi:hypothetical protein